MFNTLRKKLSTWLISGFVFLAALAGWWFSTTDSTSTDTTSSSTSTVSSAQQSSSRSAKPIHSPHQTSPQQTEKNVSHSRYADCPVDTLPREAEQVIESILDGDPVAYPEHDAQRFGNYEGVLPTEKSSYYREYTVDTPGLNHRGTRRIVVGGGSNTDPDVWYYTSDHYKSFCSIPDAED